jgi:hypothetical protein
MNMKKTIAAVAACAVAVSAVATTTFTASAEEGTLHYNLVREAVAKYTGTVTYTTTISALDISTATNVVITLDTKNTGAVAYAVLDNGSGDPVNATWTVTGYTTDSNAVKTDTFSYTNYTQERNYWGSNPSSMVKLVQYDKTKAAYEYYDTWSGKDPNYNTDGTGDTVTGEINRTQFVIPVSVAGTQAAANGRFYAQVSVTVNHSDTSWGVAGLSGAEMYVEAASTTPTGDTANATKLIAAAGGYGYPETYKYPLITTANTNANGSNVVSSLIQTTYVQDTDLSDIYYVGTNVDGSKSNILSYLGASKFSLVTPANALKTSDYWVAYTNVVPVINDVIANYDDVTFTFNTASSAVLNGHYSDDGKADKQYTSFGQHLYNYYGDEATGYVYSSAYDWTGYNLFSGALILNGQLSMSLNDTNVFDYGASTLSFNYSDAVDGAAVNTYATYLSKLQLATSTYWYWDSLDVVYANTDAEDAGTDAGVDADDDVIDEDEDFDDVVDDETDVDEDVDFDEEEDDDVDVDIDDVEPAEEEEAPAEETPVETEVAANPSTGNAPIALAVIPVALAAAAVVAKKRG